MAFHHFATLPTPKYFITTHISSCKVLLKPSWLLCDSCWVSDNCPLANTQMSFCLISCTLPPSLPPLQVCCCCVALVVSDSVQPHRWQPTRLPHPWDSPGKNTGVGCHFLLQCMKVKSESEVPQSCPTLVTPWTAAYQAPPSMGFSRQKYWTSSSLDTDKSDFLKGRTKQQRIFSPVSKRELCLMGSS